MRKRRTVRERNAVNKNKTVIALFNEITVKTSDPFQERFIEIEKEKRILEYALRSMFKINKLSGEYAALMEESIPDEKYELLMQSYEEIAKPYAYKLRKVSPHELLKEAKVVLDAIGEELGSDEIAEILELDVTEVERVLSEYSMTQRKE